MGPKRFAPRAALIIALFLLVASISGSKAQNYNLCIHNELGHPPDCEVIPATCNPAVWTLLDTYQSRAAACAAVCDDDQHGTVCTNQADGCQPCTSTKKRSNEPNKK